MLKKSGYTTHLVGKWHLGQSEPNFHPLNRGFDTFYGFMGAEMEYKKHTMGIFLNSVRYQTLTLIVILFMNIKRQYSSPTKSK